jgi:hypothetical protein
MKTFDVPFLIHHSGECSRTIWIVALDVCRSTRMLCIDVLIQGYPFGKLFAAMCTNSWFQALMLAQMTFVITKDKKPS